jgi:hypothetical protein
MPNPGSGRGFSFWRVFPVLETLHRQEHEAIPGHPVHALLDHEAEVILDLIFGRLKIRLPERISDLGNKSVDCCQDMLVLLPEHRSNLERVGGELPAVLADFRTDLVGVDRHQPAGQLAEGKACKRPALPVTWGLNCDFRN